MCADIWTRHDTLWRTDNSPTLPDWLIGSSGFRTWETRTDGSSLQSTDWLCLDWTRWTATVALRAETRWKEFFFNVEKDFTYFSKKYNFVFKYCMKQIILQLLGRNQFFHPTGVVWCSAWCAGGYRNIISTCLVRVVMRNFLFLYRSTPWLCLHFS